MTVFDYDVTLQELKFLFIDLTSKEQYLKNTSEKKKLQDLYILFKMREDNAKAKDIGEIIFSKTA